MATGGARCVYEEDDRVDESLLNDLSKWILYQRLGSLARDLGLTQAEFSRIAIATSQPEDQIFKVLLKWHHKHILSVRDLVGEMVVWQQRRYLDPGIWETFRSKVNPTALPANVPSLQLPAPPTGPYPLQLAFMELQESASFESGAVLTRKVVLMEEIVTISEKGKEQDNYPQEYPSSTVAVEIQGIMDEAPTSLSPIDPPPRSDSTKLQDKTVRSDQNDSLNLAKTLTTEIHSPTFHDQCTNLQSTTHSHPRNITVDGTKVCKNAKEESDGRVADQSSSTQSEANRRKTYQQTSCLLTPELLAKYKRYNKESLRKRLRNFLSTDWLPHEKAKTFPLRGYYVSLDWLKKIKKAMKDEFVPMSRIHDLFKQLDLCTVPFTMQPFAYTSYTSRLRASQGSHWMGNQRPQL